MIKWLKNGNDCGKCKASWESHTSNENGEEWDCGCLIKGSIYDEKVCRIPRFIRWLLIRRANYFMNHQYDGIIEFYEQEERKIKKCCEAIKETLSGRVICWKDKDGGLHEYDKEMAILECSQQVQHVCEPEFEKPPSLPKQWAVLIKKTLLWVPNKIKPFICK